MIEILTCRRMEDIENHPLGFGFELNDQELGRVSGG